MEQSPHLSAVAESITVGDASVLGQRILTELEAGTLTDRTLQDCESLFPTKNLQDVPYIFSKLMLRACDSATTRPHKAREYSDAALSLAKNHQDTIEVPVPTDDGSIQWMPLKQAKTTMIEALAKELESARKHNNQQPIDNAMAALSLSANAMGYELSVVRIHSPAIQFAKSTFAEIPSKKIAYGALATGISLFGVSQNAAAATINKGALAGPPAVAMVPSKVLVVDAMPKSGELTPSANALLGQNTPTPIIDTKGSIQTTADAVVVAPSGLGNGAIPGSETAPGTVVLEPGASPTPGETADSQLPVVAPPARPNPVAPAAPAPAPAPAPEVPAPPETSVAPDTLRTKTLEMLIASDSRWTNRAKLIERFLDEGYTFEQALGVIGNFAVEAAGDGLNPAIEQGGSEAKPKRANGKGGPGRGIGQWGAYDERYDRFGFKQQADGTYKEGTLRWFAAQSGRGWEDIDVQIDFALWELNNTQQGARKMLKAATTIEEASANFMNGFERPKVRDASPRTAAAMRSLEQYNAMQVKAQQALAPAPAAPAPPAPAPAPAPAPEAPAPAPAASACAAGTESLGMMSGWKNVQKEFCAVNGLPSSSSESTPGNQYYVEGANGRTIVSAEHSAKIATLVKWVQQDGIPLSTTSSYRNEKHQADLCNADKRCSEGDYTAVAPPGGSWHNEAAFDFYIPGLNNRTAECNTNFVASNGLAVCATPQFSKVAAWLMKNAPEVGLTQYINEYWHYDPRGVNTRAGTAVNEYRNMVLNSQEAKDIPNHPNG